ncbi:MAG: hypothetical protein ACR2QM_20325 [Longimicrobiales bacterium]
MSILAAAWVFAGGDAMGQTVPTVPQSEASAIIEVTRLLSSVEARLTVADSTSRGPLLLERLRLLYFLSVDQEEHLTAAKEQIERMTQGEGASEAVLSAFDAALEVVRGKHAFWPHQKVSRVREGLSSLDDLVSAYPNEPEVRYLRLMSCFYLPFFFRRGGTAEADLEALGGLLAQTRGTLSRRAYGAVGEFVLSEATLDPTDRADLQRALDEAANEREFVVRVP